MAVRINCRFWTISTSGTPPFGLKPRKSKEYLIFGSIPASVPNGNVVFCGLFYTLLWTFCGVLWTFLAKIKENICFYLCFSPLGKPADRAIYFACVNFFLFILSKAISGSTGPIFTIFSPNGRYLCECCQSGPFCSNSSRDVAMATNFVS